MEKYYDVPNGKLELEVRYQKGGSNWGTGDIERRGLYLHFTTVQLVNGSRTAQLYGDITGNDIKNAKVFLKELGRKSDKQIELIEKKIPFDKLAELWISKQYQEVLRVIENEVKS